MMLMTRLKPVDEVFGHLKGSNSLLLMACNGCEESFGNANPERLRYLKGEIEKRGLSVTDILTVDFLCEQLLVKHWLAIAECKGDFDAILVVSCGIGAQVVSKESHRPTYPACDTVTMGSRFGQAWGKEGCKECGQCILPYTGGICPLTVCSKGLLNGPCGGSQGGRCEVFSETRECGWIKIYEHLEAADRKDLLLGEPLVKDHSLSEPPEELLSLRNQILEKGDETL
jgi:hypothetical protein